MKTISLSFILSGCFILLLLGSCRKSGDHPDYPAGSPENINTWVIDSMKVYYYWSTSLPNHPDISQDPSQFFTGIKNPADRFSALVNPDLPATYPPSLVHTLGFDLLTLREVTGNISTVVSLVVPGSGAANQGLSRGDRISTINGTVPSAENISALTETIIKNQHAELQVEGKKEIISIVSLSRSETPVYTYRVIQSGGKNYGYIFLNSFEESAIEQLKLAFSYFKAQQVQELLLDLRYNPGGSVAVAASLAAMIAPVAAEGNTFVEYRGNAHAGNRKSSFAAELAKLPSAIRMNFSQFSNYRLGLYRVHIFTGSHTASAAELLINTLKPYITVIQTGKQTLGKDMASFLIRDYRNPQVVPKWEIYPMIFKLYNAAGMGNYSSGLVPDQLVDELSALPLKPFGDETDPLILRCTGASSAKGSVQLQNQTAVPAILYDSRVQVDLNSAGLTILRP